MNKTIIKKVIKADCNTKGLQVLLTINKENSITLAISQDNNPVVLEISYNQLYSLRGLINKAISDHYQTYSNSMEKEKTQAIYFDDPVDW